MTRSSGPTANVSAPPAIPATANETAAAVYREEIERGLRSLGLSTRTLCL